LPIDADEFEISLVEFLCNFADLKDLHQKCFVKFAESFRKLIEEVKKGE